MSIITGSLHLGEDNSWHGENILSNLCLYTNESTEQSPLFEVEFHLKAIINLTAVKPNKLVRDRWQASIIEPDRGLTSFLSQLFNEETNLCGTTKKALLVQMNRKTDKKQTRTTSYPLPNKSNLLIYGEKRDNSSLVFAQAFFGDFGFSLGHEYSTTLRPPCDNIKNDQMVLDEMYGDGYSFSYDNLISSAQLDPPTNRFTEMDIIRNITVNQKDKAGNRDLITEAKNALQEKQQLLREKKLYHRTIKSKPLKHRNTVPPPLPTNKWLTNEMKNMIKGMIKDTLVSPAKEDLNINQLIYSSIRYLYRNNTTSWPLDYSKLQCVIKMHADFYNNMESVVNLFYSNTEDM